MFEYGRNKVEKMIVRIIKIVIGAVFIPVCFAAIMTMGRMVDRAVAGAHGSAALTTKAFMAYGGLFFILLYFVLHSRMKHFFGQQRIQWVWCKLLGARPGEKKDQDELPEWPSKRLELVAYVVPIFTVIIALILYVTNVIKPNRAYPKYLSFAIGFTYMAHLFFVASDMQRKRKRGVSGDLLFTMGFVILFNIELLALMFTGLFRGFSFLQFNRRFLPEGYNQCVAAYNAIAQLFR